MDTNRLKKHINDFIKKYKTQPKKFADDLQERKELISYYQSFTKEKILNMDKDQIYEYISKLWAMLIWGNKHYVIDKIIDENGLDNFKKHLTALIWGKDEIEKRWDIFPTDIKGMGPAMISEILCRPIPTTICYGVVEYLSV